MGSLWSRANQTETDFLGPLLPDIQHLIISYLLETEDSLHEWVCENNKCNTLTLGDHDEGRNVWIFRREQKWYVGHTSATDVVLNCTHTWLPHACGRKILYCTHTWLPNGCPVIPSFTNVHSTFLFIFDYMKHPDSTSESKRDLKDLVQTMKLHCFWGNLLVRINWKKKGW